jgi:hypothetical protein
VRLTEFRRAQDTITRPVVTTTVAVLRTLAGRPLTTETWRLLLGALYPAVVQARQASHLLAVRFYLAQREQHTHRPAPSLTSPHYELTALDHGLSRTARPRLADPTSARAAISDTAGMLARHVEQAGRDTIITATGRDRVRWARVPTGRETCAFCWMLASRGPVYASQQSAGEMTAWHDRCDCQAVPVFNADRWDGRSTFLTAQRLWQQSTRGRSGRDALNTFRRALSDSPPQPDTRAA